VLKVKVCGLTDSDNFHEVASLKGNYLGLIFVKSSPRYVTQDKAGMLATLPREGARLTGVFRNEEIQSVKEYVSLYGLDAVQLHGVEEPSYFEDLRTAFPVLEIFQGVSAENLASTAFSPAATYMLIDNKSGGTGEKFDWRILDTLNTQTPFFLAGGLKPEDAPALLELSKRFSNFAGVDLNSGFETAPGIKNSFALKRFFSLLGRMV